MVKGLLFLYLTFVIERYKVVIAKYHNSALSRSAKDVYPLTQLIY